MPLSIIISGLALALLAAFLAGRAFGRQGEVRRNAAREDRVRSAIGPTGMPQHHARRSGWLQDFGRYELISLDQGKTWWSVSDEGSTISAAEPDLVKRIIGLDSLIRHAERNGPIRLNSTTAPEISLLRDTGFTVKPAR